MLPLMSKPSGAAPASLFYITIGSMMTVWSGIWFMYLRNNPPTHAVVNYLCAGFVITGLVLAVIGFTLGPISRLARHAELPPEEVAEPSIHQAEQASTVTRRAV